MSDMRCFVDFTDPKPSQKALNKKRHIASVLCCLLVVNTVQKKRLSGNGMWKPEATVRTMFATLSLLGTSAVRIDIQQCNAMFAIGKDVCSCRSPFSRVLHCNPLLKLLLYF